MDQSFAFYAVAVLAIMLTGMSKSGFGGGLGVMAVPLMSLFVTPHFAAAVMMPILLAMDLLIVWRYRSTWDRRLIFGLLPAAFVGLALGSVSFHYLDATTIKFLVGLLAAFFVVQFVASRRVDLSDQRTPLPVVFALGTLSGFASFIAHAGGPPVKGYLLRQQLEKSWFVGTNTVFFFALNFLKTIAYGAFGTLSVTSLQVSAVLSPMLLLGVFLGFRLHTVVDQRFFVNVVYGFLALTATKLLYDSGATFPF
ncbi:sulfite exporter TauE/SafE family protein [Rhodophyticola sp. CCM32]|uniref:sulfite exporter TauE/SafE family protein n=1 Tax=Rhodophyticola sp. CCM32 TaxID=2916397 RepID=UPI00107F34E3|nr:sulfite exporter TauE/SafE family protein [Rhodophyticola sp. CCM32]QBY02552.1 sulfite exporter TauE/SafE family protein [Rhodophyticola sp. CCM32]